MTTKKTKRTSKRTEQPRTDAWPPGAAFEAAMKAARAVGDAERIHWSISNKAGTVLPFISRTSPQAPAMLLDLASRYSALGVAATEAFKQMSELAEELRRAQKGASR